MAAGASVVEMIFFMRRSLAAKNPSHNGHKGSQRNPGRKGGHLEFQTFVRLCDLCVRLFDRETRPSTVVSGRIPSILRAYHGRLDFKENIGLEESTRDQAPDADGRSDQRTGRAIQVPVG